jgi:toxin ParE1/3/4
MQIKWLDLAVVDLQHIYEYIQNNNPGAARKLASSICEKVELLAKMPHLGKPGRVTNTRELILPGLPYIVPYRVRKDRLEILRVLHTSIKWLQDF